MSIRMQIVWSVLEAAKYNSDQMVIAACRRCIVANRAGKRFDRADWALISEFA